MEVKKKHLVHLALLTAGILLILGQYELYEKQQKVNLNIGKELFCNHAAHQTVLAMSLLELKLYTLVLCLLWLIITRLSSVRHFADKKNIDKRMES